MLFGNAESRRNVSRPVRKKSAALFHLQLLLLLVLCCSPGPPWYLHLKIDRNGVQHVINSITALLEIFHFSRFFFKSNYFDLISLNICENSGKIIKIREKYVNNITFIFLNFVDFFRILIIFPEFSIKFNWFKNQKKC